MFYALKESIISEGLRKGSRAEGERVGIKGKRQVD